MVRQLELPFPNTENQDQSTAIDPLVFAKQFADKYPNLEIKFESLS